MAVLVCGGAGYIGSHTVLELIKQKEKVVVYDNLSKGHEKAVSGCAFIRGDIKDTKKLLEVFKTHEVESVINFAASIEAGESMKDPAGYYDNNVSGCIGLLSAMKQAGVGIIVFSSTAAVYGMPEKIPIKETDTSLPINPYGETKLAVERMLGWFDKAYGIKYIALRYFNAAGAHESGRIGEDHEPETHLIPIILKNALGLLGGLKIFGDDYDTRDGTCIRDYIHVSDLARAHCLALERLRRHKSSDVFNLGNGKGFSNREIVDSAIKVTGIKIPYQIYPRRKGDPDILIASPQKAEEQLHWKPGYKELEEIIETAWKWHKNNPRGYNML